MRAIFRADEPLVKEVELTLPAVQSIKLSMRGIGGEPICVRSFVHGTAAWHRTIKVFRRMRCPSICRIQISAGRALVRRNSSSRFLGTTPGLIAMMPRTPRVFIYLFSFSLVLLGTLGRPFEEEMEEEDEKGGTLQRALQRWIRCVQEAYVMYYRLARLDLMSRSRRRATLSACSNSGTPGCMTEHLLGCEWPLGFE